MPMYRPCESARWRRQTLALALVVACAMLPGRAAAESTWDYYIRPDDTPAVIDGAETSAFVDVGAHEIRLPAAAGKLAAFWPDGSPDYVVAAPGKLLLFSWDGTRMVEQTVAALGEDPISVAAPLPYPDVSVLVGDTIQHWSFTGTGWSRNPALEVAGLWGAASLAARGEDAAAVVNAAIRYYRYDPGSGGMVRVPELEPQVVTALDVALRSDTQEIAVLEQDRVRIFGFTGTGVANIPWLEISGLSAPRAVVYADSGDVVVIDGNEVRHYSFTGNAMVLNTSLTVSTGLVMPVGVAVRPGSYDRIVVDGDEVRYYRWDDQAGALVLDPARSVTVPGLSSLAGFVQQAVAQSQGRTPDVPADLVRVLADHELPPETQVTWYVTADGGVTWVPAWRVRADSSGRTYCEVAQNGGNSWQVLGTAVACGVAAARPELWTPVPSGTDVRWRAVLESGARDRTPRVRTEPAGGVAVRWEANARPLPPILQPGPGNGLAACAPTATPTFRWTFQDPDPDDRQAAYQVQVFRLADQEPAEPIYDTGKLPGEQEQHTMPAASDPEAPGPLWASGTYQYKWRVRVWDNREGMSDWSAFQPFCVTALERLRVAEIVAPPEGQLAPDPNDPATHIMVWPGMAPAELPRARAGARVRVIVDGIGPAASLTASFQYIDGHGQIRTATLGDASPQWEFPPGSEVNRWTIDFWTEANLETVPLGTLVSADLQADGPAGPARLAPGPVGVVVTDGSIYDEFVVILWR